MGIINKLGTQVKIPDGRVGTVVYNSLIGVGIKWGLHNPKPEDFEGTTGNTVTENAPENWKWEPDALLRDDMKELDGMECVCKESEVKILRDGLGG